MMTRWLAVLALMAASALTASGPIHGRWITASKDAVIAIAPCGAKLCGSIERFLIPPPKGADQRDVNNADPALRGRKLLGLAILTGFTADGDVWRGHIYDPKTGKTYRSILRRKDDSSLEVKGCLGPFCKTQIWRRAP